MKDLFKKGDRVTHSKGGLYIILFSPNDGVTLEKTNEPAYIYKCVASNIIWCRRHLEMEDGRFSLTNME